METKKRKRSIELKEEKEYANDSTYSSSENEEEVPSSSSKKTDNKHGKSKSSSKPIKSTTTTTTSSSSSTSLSSSSSSKTTSSNSIFCSGLPYDANENDIRGFFKDCGEIISIRAPTYHDSGRLRGYAHIDFLNSEGASKALAKDGKYLKDRFINVELANNKQQNSTPSVPRPANCTTLFIKGLAYEAEESDLKNVFSRFGHVVSTRIARWSHTHNSKGFGYVQYEHGYSADAAMKYYQESLEKNKDFIQLKNRPISQLDWDTGAPKASFRTADKQFFTKTEEGKTVHQSKKKPTPSSSSSSSYSHKKHTERLYRDAGIGATTTLSNDDKERKQQKKEKRSKHHSKDHSDTEE